MMGLKPWLLLLLGVLWCGSGIAQGVYRWVDETGRVHYGDRPPAQAEKLDIAPPTMGLGNTLPDSLAGCLGAKGVRYYSASWCGQCRRQEALFGPDAGRLPAIECAARGGGQTKVCERADVQAYPTWEFADGSRARGVQSLQRLAERSGCPLPG